VDCKRSVLRIGYCVYKGLFMPGDHYYNGKIYGKPEPGPKFEWMKVKCQEEVEERRHWYLKTTITQEGKPIEIKVTCELTFRKNNSLIVSLIDTERAESVGKVAGT
jgi:hypothetical protein